MTEYFNNGIIQLYLADAMSLPIPDNSVDCVVTSPPYWGLRDYSTEGQLGLEETFEEWVVNMVAVFREVWRVLKPTGTVWMNLGDSYAANGTTGGGGAVDTRTDGRKTTPGDKVRGRKPEVRNARRIGLKAKDLVGIPWRVAFALQADGWYLRSDIIWSKPNPMPESVTDRPTKAHEYVFLLTKSPRYYYDADAIREAHTMTSWTSDSDSKGLNNANVREHARFEQKLYNPSGRNKRTVWEIPTQPYPEAHFATYPEKLVEPCILAGTSEKGVCSECGKPWERITDTPDWYKELDGHTALAGNKNLNRGVNAGFGAKKDSVTKPVTTIGWEPTCECNADTVPATVLDPFAGSGTTMAVAQRLGRKGIGTDISGEYLQLAEKRLSGIPIPMML